MCVNIEKDCVNLHNLYAVSIMLQEYSKLPGVRSVEGALDKDVSSVVFDSRQCVPGCLFVAVPGTVADGHDYIPSAIRQGASSVACTHYPEELTEGVTFLLVEDTAAFLGEAASLFYGHPSRHLKLVGVTGTNGKTTTATLLYDLFRALGHSCGLLSTVVNRVGDQSYPATHTTPDAVELNLLLKEMVDSGCEYCFMEVSSHSVVQQRIAGLVFAGGLFTNITHDHLDYHGTFAAYIKAKQGFFDHLPRTAFALYNADDRNGEVMVQNSVARRRSFALKRMADYRCRIIESLFGGMLLEIDSVQVWVRFIGGFNAYNLLGVYAAACELGADKEEVLRLLSTLHSVSGRFDYVVSPSGVTAIVDYAHTPDALANVLDTINAIRKPGQKLYTVVGCGGNRDKTKRPVMARLAVDKSDFTILTSDNPRYEKPEEILRDMEAGVSDASERWIEISDRSQAIKMAVHLAHGGTCPGEGDIILVAGKGHETYQEISGVRHHFDDKEQLCALLGIPESEVLSHQTV